MKGKKNIYNLILVIAIIIEVGFIVKVTFLNTSSAIGEIQPISSEIIGDMLNRSKPYSSTSASEATTWKLVSSANSPEKRDFFAMDFDLTRNVALLFGGRLADSTYARDTWEWNGADWNKRAPTNSPTGRRDHAMAFDSNRGVSVMYAGFDGGWPTDTWEWNGLNWTLINPATSAPGPTGHALAYDSTRNVIVFFGGFGSTFMNETWEYNGTTWIKRLPAQSPPARAHHAMAYDASRNRTVLYGGYASSIVFSDTWEWDGNNWKQIFPSNPPTARKWISMAFDNQRKKVVLFGGQTTSENKNDTWEWDGSNWISLTPETIPSARYAHSIVYDTNRQKIILFGGNDGTGQLNDTWELETLRLEVPVSSQKIQPGESATFHFKIIGSKTPVNLSTSVLPTGITAQFLPSSTLSPSTEGDLILTTQSPPVNEGNYPIDIIATSNLLTTSLQIELSVQYHTPTPTMTLTPTFTLTPTATSTFTLTPTGTITLTPTNTPCGLFCPLIFRAALPTLTPTPTRTITPTFTKTLTPTITRTFTPTPYPQIKNGDFELGHAWWTEYHTNGDYVITHASDLYIPPKSGSWVAWLGGMYDDNSYIEQVIYIAPTTPYLVFWKWIDSSDGCSPSHYDWFAVFINGITEDSYDLCQSVNTIGWVKDYVNLSNYINQSVTLRFQVKNDSSLISSFFLEDISLQASP